MIATKDAPGLPLGDDIEAAVGGEYEVGDPVTVRIKHIVNRWVRLPHHRPPALREIEELVAFALGR
jgi:hypothetical protein|tara:strand:- start:94 stop:291 length:198 start_codon:yes stop_codon:yes gene_type:complete